MRGSTRIFRPDIYDNVFPPSPVEQALKDALEGEGEEVTPDDFDDIDKFIRSLGDLKSSTILGEDEGWV